MLTNKENLRIQVLPDSSLHAYINEPSHNEKKMVLVFSHGFSVDGTESRRIFIEISDRLVDLGYTCILFDYRGSGYSDLAFEEMNFNSEVTDLHAVLDYSRQRFPDLRLGIWGVSFGAAVAAHVASERSDVSLLVFWSLSAELYRRYKERLGPDLERKGYTYIEKGFKIQRHFLDVLKEHDTYQDIAKITTPCLLVHGDADTIAPIDLARKAHAFAPIHTYLKVISGGNHGFRLQPKLYTEAIDFTINWIREHERKSHI